MNIVLIIKKFLFLFPGIVMLFLAIHFNSIDYTDFIYSLKSQNPGMYDIEHLESYYPINKFNATQLTFVIFSSLVVIASILLLPKVSKISHSILLFMKEIHLYIKKILSLYSHLPRYQKVIVFAAFALILIHRIIYIHQIPFSTDETFPYVFFIKQNFWISIIYYPEPNHIFFNQTCSFFDLFFSDPYLSMRIPSLLFYTLLLLLLFGFTYHNFGFSTAFTALILCAFSLSASYYSINGRGYTLLSLFAFISSISIFQYCKNPEKKIFLQVFVLSSVLGSYTISIFLFPFVAMVAYGIIISNSVVRKNLLYAATITGVLVIIFYSPIISLSGIKAISGNRWVKARDLDYLIQILPASIAESIDYIIGTPVKGYLLMMPIFLTGIYLYSSKKFLSRDEKNWMLFIFISLLSSFILLFLIRNFPPYRAWTYYIYLLSICIAIILTKGIAFITSNHKIQTLIVYIAITGYTFLMISQFKVDPSLLAFNKKLHEEVDRIYKADAKSIYIDKHELMDLYLRLKYILEDKKVDLDISQWDKEKKYDFIIVYDTMPEGITNEYHQVSEFDNSRIFKRGILE